MEDRELLARDIKASINELAAGVEYPDLLEAVDRLAAIPPEPADVRRECQCGWSGPESDCLMCGSVGPLCPECRETTEVWPLPPEPVAVPDGWRIEHAVEPDGFIIRHHGIVLRIVERNSGAVEYMFCHLLRAMLAAAPQAAQQGVQPAQAEQPIIPLIADEL